jgi:RNA polymerase sigma-54 factor
MKSTPSQNRPSSSLGRPAAPTGAQAPYLALKQVQSLVMTPSLQQAIALLQMTNLELEAMIEAEMQTNPFLERAEGGTETESSSAESQINALNGYEAPDTKKFEEADDKLEYDTENVFERDSHGEAAQTFDTMPNMMTGSSGANSFDDPEFSFESRLRDEDSLFDYLTKQIQVEFHSPQDRMIAFALMEGLDEAGYFRGNLNETTRQLECELSDVELVLARLQQLEPAGIFAVNLAQCMELQLRELGLLTPKMSVLLANLQLLEKHDYKTLQKKCGITETELRDMLVAMRRTDPKPGARFSHDVAQTLIPDILMRKNTNRDNADTWILELNPDTLPKVLINQRYAALIHTKGVKKDEKQFLTEKYQGAQFLIRAMDQRAQTIIKVAAEIVRQQEGFFAYGVSFLKPMVLREVAEVVGVHESTVSRVTTGKYMTTPRGIFELKYFFSSGVGTEGGQMHASNAIKARIKELIEKEDMKAVLSDDDLVDILKAESIPVARRTVAKYRESLGIGSSVDRRRQRLVK